MKLCRQAGFEPKVGQEACLAQTGVGLVASGQRWYPPRCGTSLPRARRPVRGPAPTVEMGVVWRRDDPGVVLDIFLNVVTEVFRDLQPP